MSYRYPDLHERLGKPSSWTNLGWLEFEAYIEEGEFESEINNEGNLLFLCKVMRVMNYLGYLVFVSYILALIYSF